MSQPVDRCPVCRDVLRPVEAAEGFHRFHFDTRDPYRNRTPAELAQRLEDIADGEADDSARALRVAARMIREHLVLGQPPAKAPATDARQEALDL